MKAILLTLFLFVATELKVVSQAFTEILGRPSLSSVTVSVLFGQDMEAYWEWGTTTENYPQSSAKVNLQKDVPFETDLTGLAVNKAYYYRIRYRSAGSGGTFLSGPEHTFHTPRLEGSSFTFAIEADPHLDTNSLPEAYALTLQNILAQKPDFMFDLGDTFMSEKQTEKTQAVITGRHVLFRPYFGSVCHSAPLFLVLGNHEGELGWGLDGTPNSLAVMATNTRKLYYPNPLPNSFYTGNTKEEPFVGLRENYYAFTWGDALFVVLDPYWYTPKKPDWNWTLGSDQYTWFKKTLSESRAKYKFVFCHNLVGGNTGDARGGVEFAGLFEWGGNNADGSYGWDTYRPTWEKPIHTLMKENHVTAFFHGHDHFFGKQEKDGIVYQEVPQPSNKNITNLQASEYGYVNGAFLPGRGFLKVTVSPENVQVDYIRTYLPSEENASRKNGENAYSYTVKSIVTGIGPDVEKPGPLQLEQNFPNPFEQGTTIRYSINEKAPVELNVFDIFGRKVAQLVDQTQDAGTYSVYLNAPSCSLSSGMYYCRLRSGNYSKCIKIIYSAAK